MPWQPSITPCEARVQPKVQGVMHPFARALTNITSKEGNGMWCSSVSATVQRVKHPPYSKRALSQGYYVINMALFKNRVALQSSTLAIFEPYALSFQTNLSAAMPFSHKPSWNHAVPSKPSNVPHLFCSKILLPNIRWLRDSWPSLASPIQQESHTTPSWSMSSNPSLPEVQLTLFCQLWQQALRLDATSKSACLTESACNAALIGISNSSPEVGGDTITAPQILHLLRNNQNTGTTTAEIRIDLDKDWKKLHHHLANMERFYHYLKKHGIQYIVKATGTKSARACTIINCV